MSGAAADLLTSWRSFYALVGFAGAALIAVQFVVITFIATARGRATAGAVSAFATPTVVHLGATLVISAAMSAPWATLYPVSIPTRGEAGRLCRLRRELAPLALADGRLLIRDQPT